MSHDLEVFRKINEQCSNPFLWFVFILLQKMGLFCSRNFCPAMEKRPVLGIAPAE